VDDPRLWKGNATLELLTMEEVAKMTRLPIATLRWYRATGKGGPKSGKVGGRRVMYLRSDVKRWIQSAFEDGAA
jgi:predicted DNA-binding transcriptional regulator AlpA